MYNSLVTSFHEMELSQQFIFIFWIICLTLFSVSYIYIVVNGIKNYIKTFKK
jgi:hypothetical protein